MQNYSFSTNAPNYFDESPSFRPFLEFFIDNHRTMKAMKAMKTMKAMKAMKTMKAMKAMKAMGAMKVMM